MPYKSKDEHRNWHQRRKEKIFLTINTAKHGGCIDCGNDDPRVLEFHHRKPGEKKFNAGSVGSHSLREVQTELEKCDVLCANCHRIRHG